jgi:hypothetical protein
MFSRLDEINSTLNNSERHLNGMKSIFGGIRNYLFAKRNGVPQTGSQPGSIEPSLSAVQVFFNQPETQTDPKGILVIRAIQINWNNLQILLDHNPLTTVITPVILPFVQPCVNQRWSSTF